MQERPGPAQKYPGWGLCPGFQQKSTFPSLEADAGHVSDQPRVPRTVAVFLSIFLCHKNEAWLLFLITKTTVTDVEDTSHTDKNKDNSKNLLKSHHPEVHTVVTWMNTISHLQTHATIIL